MPLFPLFNDKVFAAALLLGPMFWWLNHRFELSQPVPELSWGLVLMVALLYPCVEELCFRGALQGALLSRAFGRVSFWGLTAANGITSALFALFHLSSQNTVWAAAVVVPSLVFGVLRERHNSTVPSIILHCFYNLGFFVLR